MRPLEVKTVVFPAVFRGETDVTNATRPEIQPECFIFAIDEIALVYMYILVVCNN